MPGSRRVFSMVDTAGGYRHAGGWMSCDACSNALVVVSQGVQLAAVVLTRTPPVEAALIPITTSSQHLYAV